MTLHHGLPEPLQLLCGECTLMSFLPGSVKIALVMISVSRSKSYLAQCTSGCAKRCTTRFKCTQHCKVQVGCKPAVLSPLFRLITSIAYASLLFALSKLSPDTGCAAIAQYKGSSVHKLLDLISGLRRGKVRHFLAHLNRTVGLSLQVKQITTRSSSLLCRYR